MGTPNSEESQLNVWRAWNVSGEAKVQGRTGQEIGRSTYNIIVCPLKNNYTDNQLIETYDFRPSNNHKETTVLSMLLKQPTLLT